MDMKKKVVEILNDLAKIRKESGEVYSQRAYEKAAKIISESDIDLHDYNEKFKGIGKKVMLIINEVLETGTYSEWQEWKDKQEKYDESDESKTIKLFKGIWGVGDVKARELYNFGFRSLDELRKTGKEFLNKAQWFSLFAYDDFLTKMDRDKMKSIARKIKDLDALKDLTLKIVGSYRRGGQSSKDVDMLVFSTKSTTLTSEIARELARKYKIEVLAMGPRKLEFGFYDLENPDGKGIWRRLDIFLASRDEVACALVTYTGPYTLNIEMRQLAKSKGWTLNEKHLIDENGKIIKTLQERDVFEKLGLVYKKPSERK